MEEKDLSGAALPVVAIIGRPNVGKSTLFNRLVGSRRPLSEICPGSRVIAFTVTSSGRIRRFRLSTRAALSRMTMLLSLPTS